MNDARWRLIIKETAEAVRHIRKLLGWSQQGLADRANVSQGAISRLESGDCAETPFRTIVTVLHELSKGATEMGLTLSPNVQGLITFISPSLGPILKKSMDPNFAALAHAYHRCNGLQKHAVAQFLVAITTVQLNDNQVDSFVPPSLEG
jgi:transcriptional regulator with XRE-family HTH domain